MIVNARTSPMACDSSGWRRAAASTFPQPNGGGGLASVVPAGTPDFSAQW